MIYREAAGNDRRVEMQTGEILGLHPAITIRSKNNVNEWHKLQMIQIDGKIHGAINDSSRTNTGAILNYGQVALRCMVHTTMVFKNLKVYTEQLPFTEVMAKPKP